MESAPENILDTPLYMCTVFDKYFLGYWAKFTIRPLNQEETH